MSCPMANIHLRILRCHSSAPQTTHFALFGVEVCSSGAQYWLDIDDCYGARPLATKNFSVDLTHWNATTICGSQVHIRLLFLFEYSLRCIQTSKRRLLPKRRLAWTIGWFGSPTRKDSEFAIKRRQTSDLCFFLAAEPSSFSWRDPSYFLLNSPHLHITTNTLHLPLRVSPRFLPL